MVSDGGTIFDLDGDGSIDLLAGNLAHGGQPQSRVLHNQGLDKDYVFEDRESSGIMCQESYASPTLGDCDDDDDLDLFFFTVYGGARGHLFRNNGAWQFAQTTDEAGVGNVRNSYQAAWSDYDSDGDLDLFAGGRLFRNSGNKDNWLKVKLQGTGNVNSSAIGAVVRI